MIDLSLRGHALGPCLACSLSLLAVAPAATAQDTVDINGAPTVGTLHLHPGFNPDPVSAGVTAGGTIEHPSCGGYVAARPSLVVDVTEPLRWLRVYAASRDDVSLRILGPDGQWRCADDTYGSHPAVDGRFRHGVWRVWVATDNPGPAANPAVVSFTTRRRQRPAEAPPAATPAANNAGPMFDPVGTATALAQSVVNTVTTGSGQNPQGPAYAPNAPYAPTAPAGNPFAILQRAGLDPSQVPPSLLSLVQQPNTGAGSLAPQQLLQLDQLARYGLGAAQLGSVLAAMAPQAAPAQNGSGGLLDPTEISRLADLARGGASLTQLQTAAAQMLGPALAPSIQGPAR